MTLAIAEGLKLPKGSRFSIGAVPAAIAGVAPTLDYRPALERREIEAVSLSDKLTFFGGNQGTFVGSDGYIQRAQTDEARFDHNPTTGESLGLLVEEQRTNLLLRSEEFDNASWAKINNVTVTANATTAPNGFIAADKIVEPASSAQKPIVQQVTLIANTTYTASVYFKAAERPTILFHVRKNDYSTRFGGYFNTSTNAFTGETFGGGVLDSFTFTDVGGGWYRCSITGNIGANTAAIVTIYLANSSNNLSYTGNGTSGIYVWGAQVEAGAFPTSYIPTTTTTVTRPADSAVLDGTGIITGTYTMVEKPEGCAVINGTDIELQNGFTIERVMVFPATLTAGQITAIRAAM